MLSILIPTYHYNIVPLINELNSQCLGCDIKFEILVYDDGSKSTINTINHSINTIQNCTFNELPHNIGRSAIRNLLGKHANYENLIFLDADVLPLNQNFIKNYLFFSKENVAVGGLKHTEKPSKKPYKLRWVYTKKREQKTLSSANFFIKKDVFKKNYFDESIKKYGYEDVVFFNNLKKNISVFTFKNQVIHHANDNANLFLFKTETALENLKELVEHGKLTKNQSSIYKYYLYLKKLGLIKITATIFKNFKKPISSNLNSNYPSMLLYDFYRLGYFCQLNIKT